MIETSEIKRANQIGYKGNLLYLLQACLDCGKKRWVRLKDGKALHRYCRNCAQKHSQRTSSRHPIGSKNCQYKFVKIKSDDFFYPMARKGGFILEHRLVMARHVQRCLLSWEVVHHKNGNKTDNRIENLALLKADSQHNKLLNKEIKNIQKQVSKLQERVTLLEAELVLSRTMSKVN